ncbi:hypothetical protein DL93DRAFT_2102154 [Clavulina sp. PMI_390]|nr:hypothetical protein DL93DRAFT_2102154 [Clavulina sp. PMI_390]
MQQTVPEQSSGEVTALNMSDTDDNTLASTSAAGLFAGKKRERFGALDGVQERDPKRLRESLRPNSAIRSKTPEAVAEVTAQESMNTNLISDPSFHDVDELQEEYAAAVAHNTKKEFPTLSKDAPPAPVPAQHQRTSSTKKKSPPSNIHITDGARSVHLGWSSEVQSLLNGFSLPWATQWEFLRFYSRVDAGYYEIDDVRNACIALKDIPNYTTNAASAPRVFEFLKNARDARLALLGESSDHATKIRTEAASRIKHESMRTERILSDPWDELDREEKAISLGDGSGHGFGVSNTDHWYGGKVRFGLKLIIKNKPPAKASHTRERVNFSFFFALGVEKPRLSDSNRIAREIGSRRVIKLTLPDSVSESESLGEFFRRKFVILGKVFQAFFPREGSCYLVETADYNYDPPLPNPSAFCNIGRKALVELFRWMNPLEFNINQPLAKYTSRIALGLSNSLPAFLVKRESIRFIDDIVVDDGTASGASHLIMTDGAGFMNDAAARAVQNLCQLQRKPVAMQGRLGGAKGMFVLHPGLEHATYTGAAAADLNSDEPVLWCRRSQVKIKYGLEDQQASPEIGHRTFDLLRSSKVTLPARLSEQIMQCLSHGGVPHEVLLRIFHQQVDSELRILDEYLPLSDSRFDQSDQAEIKRESFAIRLYDFVSGAESVPQARLRRQTLGLSRVLGLGEQEDQSDWTHAIDDNDDDLGDQSTAWAPDLVSGQPSSLAETVLLLLEAGFYPWDTRILWKKLQQCVTTKVNSLTTKYKFHVPMSAEAFAIPDPFGKLEEGQIFFRSSETWSDEFGDCHDILEGDVLVTRHPCMVASDIRKLRAINHPMFHMYTDVVLFSVKGERSALSWLGGGDYDGDTARLIWQPEIVDPFTNSPSCRGEPSPEFIQQNFQQEVRPAASLESVLLHVPPNAVAEDKRDRDLQDVVLPSLIANAQVGAFCTILDAAKSGLTVLPSVSSKDRRKFAHLRYTHRGETLKDEQGRIGKPLDRPFPLGPDLLDQLYQDGEAIKQEKAALLGDEPLPTNTPPSATLLGPQQRRESSIQRLEMLGVPDAVAHAATQKQHLNLMRTTLARMADEAKDFRSSEAQKRGFDHFTNLPIIDRQDILRSISADYVAAIESLSDECWSLGDQEAIQRLAASCIFSSTYNKKSYRYPWDVAFRDLCALQAQSTKTYSTVTQSFAERFVLMKRSVQLLKSASA